MDNFMAKYPEGDVGFFYFLYYHQILPTSLIQAPLVATWTQVLVRLEENPQALSAVRVIAALNISFLAGTGYMHLQVCTGAKPPPRSGWRSGPRPIRPIVLSSCGCSLKIR